MNQLDPGLKRLMKWAQRAPEPPPSGAPLGFSSCVIARWQPEESSALLAAWQHAVGFAGWISGVLIVSGIALFLNQQQPASTAADFVTAYQVLAKSIAP